MRTFVIGSLFLLISLASTAQSESSLLFAGGTQSLIATRDTFAIELSDQVTGGCLPNPSALKDRMEVSLRKNGYKINSESNLFSDDIRITALGYKVGEDFCVVYLSASLNFLVGMNVPFAHNVASGDLTMAPFTHYFGGTLLSGDQSSMQKRLSDQVSEYADKPFLDISRARDAIFLEFPSINAEFKKTKSQQISSQLRI